MTTPAGAFACNYDGDSRLQSLTNPFAETTGRGFRPPGKNVPETRTGRAASVSPKVRKNPDDSESHTILSYPVFPDITPCLSAKAILKTRRRAALHLQVQTLRHFSEMQRQALVPKPK